MTVFPADVTSLAAALGIGLLVGLERERKKLRNDGAREPAGLRTFAITALLGWGAMHLGGVPLLAAMAIGLSALLAIAYFRASLQDPGLTTEVALLLVLPVACAPAATAGGGRSDLITQEEIQSRHFQNAYEAVQALHANWLVTRGTDTSGTQVVVYEDLTRLGGVEALRGISTLAIKYIQHYNADEATARWGLGHGQGAIQVSTMPR